MTSSDKNLPSIDPQLNANLQKLEELSGRFFEILSSKKQINPALNGPGHDIFVKTAGAYLKSMVQNPTYIMEQQISYWGKTLEYFVDTQRQFFSEKDKNDDIGSLDKRFKHQLWRSSPFFKYVLSQYQANSDMIKSAVSQVEGLSSKDKARLEYFSGQIIDMMAPTNFFGTNPDALEKAFLTKGQSLVQGLENLIRDLEANDGELLVRLANEKAFKVGSDLASTPGKVVFRNRLFELIQYSPSTETVYRIPLLIFPPWINKYYILDLKPHNSLIRWFVNQGYTLFVASWVNADESYRDVGLEDYIEEGYLTGIRVAREICGTEQVNAVGYCIAGTTLALTLSLLKKRGDTSVKSATFFTTLTDFSDQGEFTPFLQNDFVDGIEAEVAKTGILKSFIMARTFSYLRSTDLIYTPAIRHYMMGETPPAFDLLYWNGDGANLPGRMTMQYLRGLCQRNEFSEGRFKLLGEMLDIADVDVPLISIAAEGDHIAAWTDCYRGVQKMGGRSKTFVLAQSGHIAGIVNPPSKKKYGHYTHSDLSLSAPDWKAAAAFDEGSWWPTWEAWLRKRSGKLVAARSPGDSAHPPLCPAPGEYVRAKATA